MEFWNAFESIQRNGKRVMVSAKKFGEDQLLAFVHSSVYVTGQLNLVWLFNNYIMQESVEFLQAENL